MNVGFSATELDGDRIRSCYCPVRISAQNDNEHDHTDTSLPNEGIDTERSSLSQRERIRESVNEGCSMIGDGSGVLTLPALPVQDDLCELLVPVRAVF